MTAKHIRNVLPGLFPDHRGGVHRRMIYGKPVTGPKGTYFVTSEHTGFAGRIFRVRRLEGSGANPAPVVHETTFGHLAIKHAEELA